MLPQTMRQVNLHGFGGPEVMVIESAPLPQAKVGEVLLQVVAAGVNGPDIVQRKGHYPPPPGASPVLGLELSGRVVALGEGVDSLKLGDEVCALANGGAYAEYCLVPAAQCLPVPQGVTLADAAGIPETFFTVWTNLYQRAHLAAGEWLLVHGGSSGIGSSAIQLAKARGAQVIATAGSADKCGFCLALGADHAINYREQDFVEAVKTLRGKAGVNVILDMVGGDYVARNLKILAVEGRLVQVAFQAGSKVELDLMSLMLKRQTLTGSTLRARSDADKAVIARELQHEVWPLFAQGRLKVPVFRRFALEHVAEAHRLMESAAHMGKILLDLR